MSAEKGVGFVIRVRVRVGVRVGVRIRRSGRGMERKRKMGKKMQQSEPKTFKFLQMLEMH